MTLRALIFDFDGLILDTEWPEFVSIAEVYERHGHPLELDAWRQRVGTIAGDWLAELEALLGAAVDGRDDVLDERQSRNLALVAAESPLPGIVDLIEAGHAAGLGLAVASSARTWWLDEHLTRLGLHDRFDVLLGRDSVDDVAKPAPDVYLAALESLGVDASEAIALEDSPHGVTAAVAAGLTCVAIPNRVTAGGDFSAATLLVESATALTLEQLRHLVP